MRKNTKSSNRITDSFKSRKIKSNAVDFNAVTNRTDVNKRQTASKAVNTWTTNQHTNKG